MDASRLLVYGSGFMADHLARSRELVMPVLAGAVCAFIGSFAGMRLLQRGMLVAVRIVVAKGMLLIGAGLTTGLL